MWTYHKMADSMGTGRFGLGRLPIRVAISYGFDWVLLLAIGGFSFLLGEIEPNKRPFALTDPNIAFPYTENEAVPPWMLLTFNAALPIVAVAIVALIFVPGATVPKDTPKSLIWKRKLWELHVGWLGLLLALVSAWFFTNGMKNMFGKPRPDMLSRCQPDIENAAKYVVGGVKGIEPFAQLYSADICQQDDHKKLDDGFRSYPSGHSSSAAAGLIYLSLFLASKFAVTIPFVSPGASNGQSALIAFPSRQRSTSADSYEPNRGLQPSHGRSTSSSPLHEKINDGNAKHNSNIQSLRLQAAAPPIYLLAIVLAPFCLAVFIASSRWFDFRHHGFDILFGFLMGTITSIYSFRYYHLPIQEGAGWAWGPRSRPRAFWAGVGRLGYAGDRDNLAEHTRTQDQGESGDTSYRGQFNNGPYGLTQRMANMGQEPSDSVYDVEMHRMDPQPQPQPVHNRF